MRTLRRHVLYAEQENETSVGDHTAKTNVLALWLARRQQFLHHDPRITRLLVLFWTLAKPTLATALGKSDYVAFFQCVAKALFQSISIDQAARVAPRDWLYDCSGGAKVSDNEADSSASTMSLEQFKEALFQCAELVLPVESDASVVASFFQELRDAIAVRNEEETNAMIPPDALAFTLRPLKDVAKIGGAFLQTTPPNPEHLAQIRGLVRPNIELLSLKQLLLSFNPRKLSLSRKFSSLFDPSASPAATLDVDAPPSTPWALVESPSVASLRDTSPLIPSALLSRESDDCFDEEDAMVQSIEAFPALRIGVIGPPGAGTSRVAASLAKRLGLQYVSTAMAIDDAVANKMRRNAARDERLRVRAEARVAEQLEKADAQATDEQEPHGDGEISEPIPMMVDKDVDIQEPIDEADLLFGDAEFAALQRGDVLTLDKARLLLVAFVQTTLLRGIGVVLDDVFPAEVEGLLTLDYVVALEMTQDDARQHAAGSTLAPTSRRVYSARERAMLSESDAVLRERGWMDEEGYSIVQDLGGEVNAENDRREQRRARVAEAVAAAKAALVVSTKGKSSGDDGEAEAEVSETVAAEERDEQVPNEREAEVVQTPAQRNEIPPLDEPTVSLREMMLLAFHSRYREYESHIDGLKSTPRTQVIAILAAQAVADIVAHCVVSITNNSLGICRSVTSRVALSIPLPDDLAANASRADQLRWLLYGDWTDLFTASSPIPFAHGPNDPQQLRSLSRWRACCLVSSSLPNSVPVQGDPQFAVFFNGRVYLFASALARESFAAAPLQYIKRRPPTRPPMQKLWILSSSALDAETAHALAEVVDGDHVRVTHVLEAHHSNQPLEELTEGKELPPSIVATMVTDALAGKATWVLSDLVVSKEVLDTLRERHCLPDAIVVLTADEADASSGVHTTTLDHKKQQLWTEEISRIAKLLAETQLAKAVPVLRSPLLADATETQAALVRVLSPLAPRVDTVDDGTKREAADAEEEHTRVFGPFNKAADAGDDPPPEDNNDDAIKTPTLDSVRYDVQQSAWIANRRRMGETAQFCAVTWTTKRVLVPGQPQFVASFQQQLYAFAGPSELTAFERHPSQYVPSAARATRSVVPIVWVVGVRGSEISELVRRVSEGFHGARIGVLDETAIVQRVQRRLHAQLLVPIDKQTPLNDVYVDVFAQELQHMTSSKAWDAVLVANVSPAEIAVPKQFDDDGESLPTASIPPLPTPELLALLFQRDLFPTVVLPLQAAEEIIVHRQLLRWRESVPPIRPPRKSTIVDSDTAVDSGEEETEAIDPVEREAAEIVRLQEQYQADHEAQNLAMETMRARGVTIEKAVDIDATLRAVVKLIAESIKALLGRKDSFFEYCERVSISDVSNLLRGGHAVVGKHAMQCPLTGDAPSLACGLVYRRRLYFPQSASALAKCELAPALTLVEVRSQPPQCRVSCCVVGPPCVGKTRLAKELATHFGLTYVSPRSAIDWALHCLAPQSSLWSALESARSGSSDWTQLHLAPAVVHEAIHTRLCASDCQRNGWVLDDYMVTSDQVDRCLDRTHQQLIQPGVVFALDGSIQRVWKSTTRQGELDGARLASGFDLWQTHRLDLIHTWTKTFGAFHIRQLETDTSSAWHVHAHARAVLQQLGACTRQYAQGFAMGRVVRLLGVVRPQATLEAHAHAMYQSFCPVELASGRYHTSLPLDRELCVECVGATNRRVVLWLANEQNAAAFCASPAQFLTDHAAKHAIDLIAKAPVDASLLSLLSVADCEFPEMKGYCPVTFQQGTGDKDWKAIVKGSVFYRVSYDSKVFFCREEQNRRAFLTQPTIFASLVLPIKLPPQLTTSIAFKNCPGRIEQELSSVLNETLLLLGAARPKFLGVSTTATACFYVALLLKTRATTALPDHLRLRYADQLRAFECDCRVSEQLKQLIAPSSATTSCGSGIKGARAVRELSSAASEVDLKSHAQRDTSADDSHSTEALCQRFDALVVSASEATSTNQQRTIDSPRRNVLFLDYAKSLLKTNGF